VEASFVCKKTKIKHGKQGKPARKAQEPIASAFLSSYMPSWGKTLLHGPKLVSGYTWRN